MLAPWLFGFVLMYFLPMLISIYYSFTDYNLLNDAKVIGFDNYVRIFTNDDTFWQALKVTFIYTIFLVPLRLAFALVVAMLLNTKHRGLGLYRTIYYIPSIIGGSIAVSIVWQQIFGNDGVVMSLLSVFGIEQDVSLLGNPKTALAVIILMGVWQFGSSMLIFLSALKQIPTTLYEAARVDGAGKVRQFFKITLPLLTPTVFFNLVMQMIQGFLAFTQCYIITQGKPMDSTLFYTVYMYQQSFEFKHTGYGAAMAWVMLVIVGLITLVLFATKRFWVYEDGV